MRELFAKLRFAAHTVKIVGEILWEGVKAEFQ